MAFFGIIGGKDPFKRLEEINATMILIETQTHSNDAREQRITAIGESLTEKENDLKKIKKALIELLHKKGYGREYEEAKSRLVPKLEATVNQLRAKLAAEMKGLKHISQLVEENEKLRKQMAQLVQEAEDLIIQIRNEFKTLPPEFAALRRNVDFKKLGMT